MKFLSWLLSLLPFSTAPAPVGRAGGCGHPGPRTNLKIKVFGHEVTLRESPLCAACTEVRVNACSTHCAGCDFPILPGMPVAAAWIGAPHPLTHMSEKCGDPCFYDGVWGAGKHYNLQACHPETFDQPARSKSLGDEINAELFKVPVPV